MISVIICTHNPRPDYLARTIEALQAQTLPASQWELLVVDNASERSLSDRIDLSWHPLARVVNEPELGLTAARRRGIAAANGDVLVFVDDDNVLAPEYLAQARALAESCPMLGVWGCGLFTPEWEEPPRPEFAPYLSYLAVGRHERDTWSNRPFDYAALPAGAGLCVRREIAARYARAVGEDPRRRELGRKGAGLGACEDFDLGQMAIQSGLGTGVFTRLRLTHLMPRSRVQEDYLLRLVEGHACSTVLLHHLHGTPAAVRRGPIAALRRWRFRRRLNPVERRIEAARHAGEQRAWRVLATKNNDGKNIT